MASFSQNAGDTIAAYQKNPLIPEFKILQPDSSWFVKKDLPAGKPIVISYFNPECGHCKIEAKELALRMDSLNKGFFVFTSFHSPQELKQFAIEYGLDKFDNVVFGRDTRYVLPIFYDVKFTPFTAVYNNKEGKLMKAYENGINISELIELINQ